MPSVHLVQHLQGDDGRVLAAASVEVDKRVARAALEVGLEAVLRLVGRHRDGR